jgi:hypothetical protein
MKHVLALAIASSAASLGCAGGAQPADAPRAEASTSPSTNAAPPIDPKLHAQAETLVARP